tara:strand:- start:4 stop:534 length:531 start_codon:yes stop_codon:yes gene_type:complete
LNGLYKNLEWRAEHKPSEITEEMIEAEVKDKKIFVSGFDKKRRPCIYVVAKNHDSYNRSEMPVMVNFMIKNIEDAMKQALSDERFCIVFDLRQFGMACMDYEVVQALVSILQLNYPEVMNRALIVDAPFLFTACWALISTWIDPVTVSKVDFVYASDFFQGNCDIDIDEIPSSLKD